MYKFQVTKMMWGCKYSTGNIVNNIVTAMRGVRWVLDLLRRTLSKLYNVQSLSRHLQLI